MKVLRSRLYEMELANSMTLRRRQEEARSEQVTVPKRSDYNFPQGRVTDHRIKLTLHRLESILGGDLDEIIDSLDCSRSGSKIKLVK